MNENQILDKAIRTYGVDTQIDKAVEEMSELIKALMKLRHCEKGYEHQILQDAVDEEIADVEIMLQQLRMIFNDFGSVEHQRQKKIERLERRLNGENRR